MQLTSSAQIVIDGFEFLFQGSHESTGRAVAMVVISVLRGAATICAPVCGSNCVPNGSAGCAVGGGRERALGPRNTMYQRARARVDVVALVSAHAVHSP